MPAIKKCLECGKVLKRISKETYKYFESKKFCSVKCRVSSKEWRQKMSEVSKKRNKILWANEEYRKHMSDTHKGKQSHLGMKLTEEQRKRLSESHIGIQAKEKHPNWKGGITPIVMKIRNSLSYKKWRKSIFERDSYTCQWCKKRGGILNADHVKPFSLYPNLRLAFVNGRTLCKECHEWKTGMDLSLIFKKLPELNIV